MVNNTTSPVGHAWELHRQGNFEGAIREFQQMLAVTPNDIDALYGLGLVLRSANQSAQAIENFQRCLNLLNESLEKQPNDDRYEILQRMTGQRLAELQAHQ